MSFFRLGFFALLFSSLVAFYVLPKKYRWILLLAASYTFYCWNGFEYLPFLLTTSFTVWGGALAIQTVRDKEKKARKEAVGWTAEEKSKSKSQAARKQRLIFWGVLLLNLGILGVIKYFNFASENITSLVSSIANRDIQPLRVDFIVPLGISFYTFQSVGYLIDVYNNKYRAAQNPFRFALFASFFPQITQGPIGRYDQMEGQFAEPADFELKNIEDGVLLMLWGYFKKLVIADRLAPFVATVFAGPDQYGGAVTLLAVLAYAFQLYTDFSGGIDIVTGAAELFGIRLAPNFRRPYFSVSLTDFWHRWHISLGSWMRDYVFYPFALSKPVSKMSKALKGKVNDHFVRVLPAALGNILVFTIVGVWHGAVWSYIIWGLYNGLVLAASAFMEPAFQSFRTRFPNFSKSATMNVIRIVRTFIIVLIGYYFDCNANVGNAFRQMIKIFTDFRGSQLSSETLQSLIAGQPLKEFAIVLGIAMAVLVTVSVLQEKGIKIRETLFKMPTVLRWALLYAFIFFSVTYAVSQSGNSMEGFMYAIF